jgi:axial budding pattern protein 2
MALWGFLSAVAIYGTLVVAIPTITFPLNSQVPPVARISELFSYTFSISTFSSTLPITYTLSNGPSWLSLDSSTRTLSGTPSIEAAGAGAVTGVSIDITASDSSGSITQNATLVVSKNPAPILSIPLSVQLQISTAFSAPSTLLYHPSTPFTINFQPDTFSGSDLIYYAVTVDNTPLPSWIAFDESLTFTGQTPDYHSLIQPPQTFGIQLIASDVEGFSGAAMNFDIKVGVHLLAFKNAALVINAAAGDAVNFNGLAGNLEIDERTANDSKIVSLSADAPLWLAFDNSTLSLSGIVPTDATPYNITVVATDIYGDTANAIVFLDISTSLFRNEIGTLNATIGKSFTYDLSVYLRDKSDVEITAQISPAEPWLSFDSQTFDLAGQVPLIAKPPSIAITLLATSKSSSKSSSQTFQLDLVTTTSQASPSASAPSRTLTSPNTSQTGNSTKLPAFSKKPLSRKIILAIVIPIVLLLFCILLALFCYVRRRHEARRCSPTLSKSEISGPTETSSSIMEIVPPTYIAPPPPLELDMSGFGGDTSSIVTREQQTSLKRQKKQDIRRSQTLSDISGTQRSQLQESDAPENRARSYSENAASKADGSWRSTQGSLYPTEGSSRTNSTNTQRLSRNYSNYSRKGHTRRSAKVYSTINFLPLPDVTPSGLPVEESILNLRDSNFSFAPMERFSVVKKHASIQQMSDQSYVSNRISRTKSTKRRSGFMLSRRPSGIGHGGGRDAISSFSGNSEKRRSAGHGQDWTLGQGIARNSKTWLTIGSSEADELNRRSTVSALSEYADMKPEDVVRLSTIRQVTKSPSIPLAGRPSASSEHSRRSRPVSRRLDSSPFFGGSASRNSKSRRSSKKVRTSYADSPTVPEEATMTRNLETIPQGPGQENEDLPRDSFGISYGMAREGTRQLKSYVQSHLSRSRTRNSMRSTESKDSRFESASGSLMSLHQFQTQKQPESRGDDDGYEDFLRDDYSDGEGSWETQHSPQDNQGNANAGDVAEVNAVAAQAMFKPSFIPSARISNLKPNSPMLDIEPNMRMVPGASRRPISVDAKANKRSSRARIERSELDYAAYI